MAESPRPPNPTSNETEINELCDTIEELEADRTRLLSLLSRCAVVLDRYAYASYTGNCVCSPRGKCVMHANADEVAGLLDEVRQEIGTEGTP